MLLHALDRFQREHLFSGIKGDQKWLKKFSSHFNIRIEMNSLNLASLMTGKAVSFRYQA